MGQAKLAALWGCWAASLLMGCAQMPTPAERLSLAGALAQSHGWQGSRLTAGSFELMAYLPQRPHQGGDLTVYIEGDGLAWITPDQPSADPTPIQPVGLRLALAQPSGDAAYLARPCQYVGAEPSNCPCSYWMAKRFAPEVVAASSEAIDQLKKRFNARRITLVGYSGGAAMAALLAARRSDVNGLITVAGNLDHAAWTAYHGVPTLDGSLNPAADIDRLQRLPQLHLVGEQDTNTTPALLRSFLARFPSPVAPGLHVVPGFGHQCCWAENWPSLWQAWWSAPTP